MKSVAAVTTQKEMIRLFNQEKSGIVANLDRDDMIRVESSNFARVAESSAESRLCRFEAAQWN